MTMNRLLLVEDNTTNQMVILQYLKNICNCDTAENADIAIRKIDKVQFDIILMDINLGIGMNGIELTRFLRSNNKYQSTPIIATTAYASTYDKKSILNSGCTTLLLKPFTKSQLVTLIEKYIS